MGHKVWLFGSKDLGAIPECIEVHLERMIKETNGDIEFIVGDSSGVETAFHRTLSAIGARNKSEVYCINAPRNNTYELKTVALRPEFKEETKEVEVYNGDTLVGEIFDMTKLEDAFITPKLYDIKDSLMCDTCTFALCYWDGQSRGTARNIGRMTARSKYCYVYTAQLEG